MAESERELLARVLGEYEQDLKAHDLWAAKVDRWYSSWRGILERSSPAAEWRSTLHPPYILQIVETLVAGVLDPNPRWKVRARQRMGGPEELHSIVEGAKALEILLSAQRDADGMVFKQRAHRLQGLIAGMSVWKTRWSLEERMVTRKQTFTETDEMGWPLEVEREVAIAEPSKDDPSVEVVDVRDFIPHESAKDIATAKRLTHRVWLSFEDLKELERQGVYRNVDELKESKSFSDALASREQSLFQVDRTKDLIEVLERWDDEDNVITIGNKKVLLAKRSNRKEVFAHGHYPFIACGPMPDLFRMQGISVVELVEDLQEMLWTLQNQRLDNLELLNNLIMKQREGSMLETPIFAPGEVWLMDDLSAVEVLNMPSFPADISLQAEGLIKADIQNIPGASPALLGQAETVEQTATEISLLTNLAQRRLSAQKFQFTLADKLVGEDWIELNDQFLTEERYVAIVGEDGDEGWVLINPEVFRGYQWKIEVEQMDESMLRQERLAEAQARFQVAIAAAPLMAAIGQPLNMRAYVEDTLDAAGITDKDRYFSAQPQQPGMPQGGANGQPPPTPEGQLTGTAPQAVDMNAPSNQFSQSPVAAIQRMLAEGGGPVNV